MADVITRFKLETTQYDSKLRDASRQLADYAREANYAGKEFGTFSKEQEDAARSLGGIATSAKTAKEKVGELVNAYNTVAKAYNKLTEEQRQSDYGKAMAESLNTLKGRIGEAKKELYDLGNEGEKTGSIMGELSKKFTINIDALKLLDIGLKAANGALSVAKDAFFSSEQNIDEWGRIVASAKSLYNGFLNALNTGDISGYLSRIDDIVNAARTAYNELDRLGTMRTIQAPQMSAQQAENDRIRMMLQTGRGIASANGSLLDRLLGIRNGNQLSPEVLRVLEKTLEQGVNNTVQLVKNEVEQSTKSIDAIYKSLALTNGMSLADFRQGTSSMAELDKRIEGAKAYRQWANENSYVDTATGAYRTLRGNPYANFRGWEAFLDDSKEFKDLIALIVQRDQQMSQMYSMQGQAYRAMNRMEGITVRGIMGGGGSSSGRGGAGNNTSTATRELTGLIEIQEAKINDLRKAWSQAATEEGIAEYRRQLIMAKIEMDELKGKSVGGISISGLMSEQLRKDQAAFRNQKLNVRTVDREGQTVSVGQTLGSLAGGMSQIAGGIEQLGIDIPEGFNKAIGVMQAVAAILTGISTVVTIIAAIQGTKAVPIIGWALARGGVVKAAGGYQVPGNNYSNDMVPALLNSGELVLNKAQQGNLAAQLSGGQGGYAAQPYVNGEMILLGTNNYLGRSGQGEVVTTKMLKSMGLMK